MGQLKYVLITPARNEADFIELTINSVVAQTVPPVRWVIVSDGSTDGTDSTVKTYANKYPWIQLVQMPERKERHFAGKVQAFNAGYAIVKDLDYDAIGSLDGDLSFDKDYFSFLLGKLVEDPTRGVVGTPFRDPTVPPYDYRFVGIDHVSGACQFFRRECFEQIGGYIPIKGGGVDYVAILAARMKGWRTRTFLEKELLHHRPMGTAQQGQMKARFKIGRKDYALGGHPLWEILRTGFQMGRKPYFVGGLIQGAGYLWAMLRREERPISWEMLKFRRREQMERLRGIVAEALPKSFTEVLGISKSRKVAQGG